MSDKHNFTGSTRPLFILWLKNITLLCLLVSANPAGAQTNAEVSQEPPTRPSYSMMEMRRNTVFPEWSPYFGYRLKASGGFKPVSGFK